MKQRVGDVSLYYETHGAVEDFTRPWLVFSHSLACNTSMWTPQIAAFSGRYRILTYDTRGHGRSDAPPDGYTMDTLAADLHGLLSALGITKAHYVGLSMGGMIGQAFALRYPGLFASLTLADTTSRWPEETLAIFGERARVARTEGMEPLIKATLGRWFTPRFHQSNPAEVARVGEMIRATPIAGYVGCSDSIPRVNFTARLREIKCPILVMVGKEDPGTPEIMSHVIHENAPGSKLVLIEQAAHLSNIEQADVFNRELLAFLSSCDSRAA